MRLRRAAAINAVLASFALLSASCFGRLHDAVHLPPGEPDPDKPPEVYEPWEPEPGAPVPRKLEDREPEPEREDDGADAV